MSHHHITHTSRPRRRQATAATLAVVLATSAGPAWARTDVPPQQVLPAAHHVVHHAVAAQSLGLQHRLLGEDARPAPSSSLDSPPAAIVRSSSSPAADGGIDWAEVGIGGGLAAAVLLSAAGVSLVRRQPRMRAH